MEISYSRSYTNLLIGIGVVNVVIGVASFVTRSPTTFLLIAGGVLTIIGIWARTRIYFTIQEDRILLHALVGPLTRTFHFNSLEDVSLEGNNLYIIQNGKRIKLPISRWIVDPGDWEILEEEYGKEGLVQN